MWGNLVVNLVDKRKFKEGRIMAKFVAIFEAQLVGDIMVDFVDKLRLKGGHFSAENGPSLW